MGAFDWIMKKKIEFLGIVFLGNTLHEKQKLSEGASLSDFIENGSLG